MVPSPRDAAARRLEPEKLRPRLLLAMVYIGSLGSSTGLFDVTRASILANAPTLEVMLATDQPVVPAANLHVVSTSMDDLRDRLRDFLRHRSANNNSELLQSAYKLCDLKVVYRSLFHREILALMSPRPMDFVGFGDLDVVYGNVAPFMFASHRLSLNQFDAIGVYGHLMAMRWTVAVLRLQHTCGGAKLRERACSLKM
jgi:hypothetical protein